MIKKSLLFTSVSIFFLIATFACTEQKLLNDQMSLALKKFNPRFEAWKPADYAPAIQKSAIEDKRLPYALILDLNKDKKNDLILDGHDDKNNLLICLLSNPEGYSVIVIDQKYLVNPQELEHWDEDKKQFGLNYYLLPNTEAAGFTLAYPQEFDAKGELGGDGAMAEYIFKNGKFDGTVEIL